MLGERFWEEGEGKSWMGRCQIRRQKEAKSKIRRHTGLWWLLSETRAGKKKVPSSRPGLFLHFKRQSALVLTGLLISALLGVFVQPISQPPTMRLAGAIGRRLHNQFPLPWPDPLPSAICNITLALKSLLARLFFWSPAQQFARGTSGAAHAFFPAFTSGVRAVVCLPSQRFPANGLPSSKIGGPCSRSLRPFGWLQL